MVLATTNVYYLPDGTRVLARPARGRSTLEWTFVDVRSGEPLYLLDRDERVLLRYMWDEAFQGYVPSPCDLMLDDLRMARPWMGEE